MRSVLVVLAAMLALAGCEELNLNTNKAGDDAVETDTSDQAEDVIETDASEPQADDGVVTEADTMVMDDETETDIEESNTSALPESCPDLDGDGICVQNAAGEELDCDDEDPDTFKNAPELCDGIDNDCDGQVDDGVETWLLYADHDGDGYGSGEKEETCSKVGFANEAGDCNDSDPDIHPGADDPSGDSIDQNCDDGMAVEQGSSDADAGATETNTDESDAGMDPEAVFGGVITHENAIVDNDSDAGSTETEEDTTDSGSEMDESDAGSTEVDSGDTEETDVTNANEESDAGSTDSGTTETDAGTEPVEDEVTPVAYLTSAFEEEHELSLTYQLAQSEEDLGSKWDNESDPVVEDSDDSVYTEFELDEDIAFVRVNVTIDGETWLCSGNGETAEVYEGSFTTLDLPTGYQGMAPFIWDDPSGNGCSLVFEVWYVGDNN